MSAKRLPRELGVILLCNGSDTTSCDARVQIANIHFRTVRKYAASLGWIRGLRRGFKRRDHCPACAVIEKQLYAEQKAARAAWVAKRDEKLKARSAA